MFNLRETTSDKIGKIILITLNYSGYSLNRQLIFNNKLIFKKIATLQRGR